MPCFYDNISIYAPNCTPDFPPTALDGSAGLRISSMVVPEFVKVGSSATLHCKVDLGEDVLYSLSWYRENQTFYEFNPLSNKKMAYNQTLVIVDVSTTDLYTFLFSINIPFNFHFTINVGGQKNNMIFNNTE